MASMKGSKAAKHVRGKVRRMVIKHAAKPGTYVSETERDHPGGMMMSHGDEPPTVHPSMNHLKAHIASTMAPGEPDEDDAPQNA